jgi:Tol biopolymer transport system component
MHADGTHLSPLTVTHWNWEGRLLGLMDTWSPSWAPDTSRLVVQAACRGYCEDQTDDFLMIINTDGFDPQVHVASLNVLSSPAWSPDGKWLAYAVLSPSSIDNRIGFYSILGDEFASFKSQGCFSDGACDSSTLPYYSSPTWSPDSRRLAYVASSREGDASRILMKEIDADDSFLVSLTPPDAIDADPAWSPDGSEIAFTSLVGGHWHVFIMNTDGSNRRQLTDGTFDEHHPTWSPTR